jgi:hypothetical protein
MNQAIEMLRSKAAQVVDYFAPDSGIEFNIDPIEDVHVVENCSRPIVYPTMAIMKRTEQTERLEAGMKYSANLNSRLCLEQLNLVNLLARTKRVWIYNISQQEYVLGNSVIRKLKVPARKDEEDYAVVTSFPELIAEPVLHVDNNETHYYLNKGERLAMDLINPSNLGLDQDATGMSYGITLSTGTNFSDKGVFFSTQNPPLRKDLAGARKRYKKYCTALIERANIERLTSAAPKLMVTQAQISEAYKFVNGNKIVD